MTRHLALCSAAAALLAGVASLPAAAADLAASGPAPLIVALQPYIDTGANAAVAAITAKAGQLQDDVRDARIAFILDWAEQGAAGAIRHFGVDQAQLETLATAKLQRALGLPAAGG